MDRALCWLRRDLRPHDNTALAEATAQAENVHVVFVFDTDILDALPSKSDARVTFIDQSLAELRDALGGCLTLLHGSAAEVVPRAAEAVGAEAVFAAHDDDPYAVRRDAKVAATLKENGRTLHSVKDHVVFERRDVVNATGEPFKVYTPYRNAWHKTLRPGDMEERRPDFSRVRPWPATLPSVRGAPDTGFRPREPWIPGGATAARRRLDAFLARIDAYKELRDFPSDEATSTLSADLRFGTVSVRECVREAWARPTPGAAKWLDELVWREFYHMILANFPFVAERPFRHEFDGVTWPGDAAHFEPWASGSTGYPIVDAAMRCLNETGWMHNRLRMVVAMFLTKDLLLDYRLGEAYFAAKLLDFDLANNNGGWQWSASTGVDAQPWFRIFNPVLQSRKFDPKGAFIRRWCPELAGYDDDQVHWPAGCALLDQLAAGCEVGREYPLPIVDHAVQRDRALAFLEGVTKRR